jgi:hypothetical protein
LHQLALQETLKLLSARLIFVELLQKILLNFHQLDETDGSYLNFHWSGADRRKLNDLTQIMCLCPGCHFTLPDPVMRHAARLLTTPAHAPRRPAADLTGSHAAPHRRRPHWLTCRATRPSSSPARAPRRPCCPPAQLSSSAARPPAQPFGHWSPTPGPRDANARPRRPPSPPGSCLHREGEVRPRLRSPATDECRAQVSSSPLLHGRFGGRFF